MVVAGGGGAPFPRRPLSLFGPQSGGHCVSQPGMDSARSFQDVFRSQADGGRLVFHDDAFSGNAPIDGCYGRTRDLAELWGCTGPSSTSSGVAWRQKCLRLFDVHTSLSTFAAMVPSMTSWAISVWFSSSTWLTPGEPSSDSSPSLPRGSPLCLPIRLCAALIRVTTSESHYGSQGPSTGHHHAGGHEGHQEKAEAAPLLPLLFLQGRTRKNCRFSHSFLDDVTKEVEEQLYIC